MNALFDLTLALADDALILGHRMSEWCRYAPTHEEDLALANIGLDLLGQGALFLGLAGTNSTNGKSVIPFLQPNKEAFLEYDIAKPSLKLANPLVLDLNALIAELKKLRGKKKPLSLAALRDLSEEQLPRLREGREFFSFLRHRRAG